MKFQKGSPLDSALSFKFIFPILLENIFTTLLTLLTNQTFSTVSESALTAVTISNQVISILSAAFFLFEYGTVILVARDIGAGHPEKAKESAEQAILHTFLFAALVVAICEGAADFLFRLLMPTAEEQLLTESVRYFRILAVSFIPLSLSAVSISVFRALGDTTRPLLCNTTINLFLLGFSLLLIRGFKMDVVGAGLSYVIARFAGAILILTALFRKTRSFRLSFRAVFKRKKGFLKRISNFGVAILLDNVSIQIAYLLTGTSAVYLGAEEAAAYSILQTLTSYFGSVLSLICNPISLTAHSHLLGAGKFEQSKKASYKILAVSMLISLSLNVGIVLLASPLSSFYTEDPEVLRISVQSMWILIPLNLFGLALNVLTPKLTAAGDTKFVMFNSMFSVWLVRVPLTIVFSRIYPMGVLGLYWANIISLIIRNAGIIFRLLSNKWYHEV